MPARVYELQITTKADVAGVTAATTAVQGLNKEARDLEKEFEAVRSELEKQGRALGLTAEGAQKYALVVKEMVRDLDAIEKAPGLDAAQKEEQAAIAHAKMSAALKELSENHKDADAAINKTGRTMEISRERAVMMGNALAGIVSQLALGADGTQLMASGATSLAMILSTAGPWGIAAGFAIQTLTTLGLKYKQTSEEAEKAAAKEVEAMTRTTESIRNANIHEDQWRRDMEKGNRVVDDRVTALKQRNQAEQEATRLIDAQRTAQDDLNRAQDAAAVASGKMSEATASENERKRQSEALFARHRAELEQDAKAEQDAIKAAENASAREQSALNTQREAEEQYANAKRAKAAQDAAAKAKQREDQARREMNEVDANFPEFDPDPDTALANHRAKQEEKAKKQTEIDAARRQRQAAEREIESLGRFDTKDGQVDIEKYQTQANQAREAGEAAKVRAERERNEANASRANAEAAFAADRVRQQRERDTLTQQQNNQRAAEAAKSEGNVDKAAFRDAQSELKGAKHEGDEGAKELLELLKQLQKEQTGKNQDFANKLGLMIQALGNGTNVDEMNRIVTALHQHMSSNATAMSGMAQMAENVARSSLAMQQQINAMSARVNQLSAGIKGAQ
jgi:hypothetical protein